MVLVILFICLRLLFASTVRIVLADDYVAPQKAGTTVSATVSPPPSLGLSIFGYTSPQALVNLEGKDLQLQTNANNDGFFIFQNIAIGSLSLELCLTAQDQFGRISKPVCLPPLSNKNDYNLEIGPVLLPPTLSLNQPVAEEAYFIGSDVLLTGQTVPNSVVNLSMFTKKSFIALQPSSLIKPVEAFSFPPLETSSDEEGNFSLSLPSTSSKTYRLFAQTTYRGFRSPDSFTLQLNIFPVWLFIVRFLVSLLLILKSRWLEISLLALFIFFLIKFLRRYFHPYIILKPKAIIVRKHYDLILPENKIVLKDH